MEPKSARTQNIDTKNAISVDVEISDELKKAKLENGFYDFIDGERVSARKTLSVVNTQDTYELGSQPFAQRSTSYSKSIQENL